MDGMYRADEGETGNGVWGKELGQLGDVGQQELFEQNGVAALNGAVTIDGAAGQDAVLFKAMERAIAVIRKVIAEGISYKLDRENLLDHIREVLCDYGQLRGTVYDQTINKLLVRVCASEFSLVLDESELAALWQ